MGPDMKRLAGGQRLFEYSRKGRPHVKGTLKLRFRHTQDITVNPRAT
jgi:hypothetical protein